MLRPYCQNPKNHKIYFFKGFLKAILKISHYSRPLLSAHLSSLEFHFVCVCAWNLNFRYMFSNKASGKQQRIQHLQVCFNPAQLLSLALVCSCTAEHPLISGGGGRNWSTDEHNNLALVFNQMYAVAAFWKPQKINPHLGWAPWGQRMNSRKLYMNIEVDCRKGPYLIIGNTWRRCFYNFRNANEMHKVYQILGKKIFFPLRLHTISI